MPVTIQLTGLKYKNSQGQFQSADCLKGEDADISIIAPDYSELTFPVNAGKLCTHDLKLYRAKQGIPTSENWTESHWDERTIEEELAAKYTKPAGGIPASDLADGVIPDIIDDEAGAGDTDVTFSADKLTTDLFSLSNALNQSTAATNSDIGKAHSPKTVVDGKVTEWQYVPVGGGGSEDAIAPDYDNLTFPVLQNRLCFHDGILYFAKEDIYISEVWTLSHWEQTTIDIELSKLQYEFMTTWEQIRNDVRLGKASKYAIGDELVSSYTYNGVTYECPWVVLDNNRDCEWADGTTHPGLWIGMKYCTAEDVQFDAAENNVVDLTEEPNALEGWYYWGLTGTTYTALNVSTGDALPTTYESIRKCHINNVNVLRFGYNRWSHSGQRQWLNSNSTGIGEWWEAQHPGDVAPSQLANLKGFKAGLPNDFLAVIMPVKVRTLCNTVTDGGVTDTTVDTFFIQSREEVYGAESYENIEGPYFPYWKTVTGLTDPTNGSSAATNSARRIKRVSSQNGSAIAVRLRSDVISSAHITFFFSSNGYISEHSNGGTASDNRPAMVACVIS